MTTSKPFEPRTVRPLLAMALGAVLASCAVGPDYQRPAVAAPAGFKEAPSPVVTQPVVAENWWTLFGDPVLNQLAADTIAANQNIQAAMARLEQAHQARLAAIGNFAPAVELAPTARRSRTNSSNGSSISTQYSLPLDLSYEFDVWGKLRRQYEYYKNSEIASADDLAWIRATAVAEVAQAYFTIGLYDRQIALLQEAQQLYQRQLDLTTTKHNVGLALTTDVLQARNQLNSAQTQLIETRRSRLKQEHAIAILLGRAPSDFTLPTATLPTAIPQVPTVLPVTLLERRPDIAEAERTLAAANAQIGVAKANFFPSFTLTASAGYQSSNTQHLLDWENRVWSIAPSLNLPIFQGGRLTAALAQAKARYQELVATYRNSVLGAFRDVEDELSDLQLLTEKAKTLDETLVSAQENARLTELQYRQGLSTYLQVITANQTLLTTELSAIQAQAERLSGTVLLIKALGGGWQQSG